MRAPQAPNRTADLRLSAVSLAIRSPVSTAPAETVLQPFGCAVTPAWLPNCCAVTPALRRNRGSRDGVTLRSESSDALGGAGAGWLADDAAKADFLGNATALLFPIDWPEPFGLVVIEAMACGTPVIARRRGSVPEIVDHGVTGFIVENESQAIEAISALDRLDRQNIRQVFEQRFTATRMAQEYLHCFENVARTGERF